jgi:hypothetical protein
MARARNIKPSLFKNELLGVEDPLLTLLFISLWTLADKRGRLEDRPLRIKAETFPYRENIDINGYLTELQRLGFICRYTVDGKAYIQVENFEKHQAPHKTEKESEIPPPPPTEEKTPLKTDSCSLTVKPPLNDGEKTEPLPPDSLIPDSSNTDSGFIDSPAEPEPQAAATKKIPLDYSPWPDMPSKQVMTDWKAMRKRKRADVNQTVIDRLAKQLHVAVANGMTVDECLGICVEKGWTGFEYQWVINLRGATNHAPNTPNRGKTWAERRDDLTDAVTNYERATNF